MGVKADPQVPQSSVCGCPVFGKKGQPKQCGKVCKKAWFLECCRTPLCEKHALDKDIENQKICNMCTAPRGRAALISGGEIVRVIEWNIEVWPGDDVRETHEPEPESRETAFHADVASSGSEEDKDESEGAEETASEKASSSDSEEEVSASDASEKAAPSDSEEEVSDRDQEVPGKDQEEDTPASRVGAEPPPASARGALVPAQHAGKVTMFNEDKSVIDCQKACVGGYANHLLYADKQRKILGVVEAAKSGVGELEILRDASKEAGKDYCNGKGDLDKMLQDLKKIRKAKKESLKAGFFNDDARKAGQQMMKDANQHSKNSMQQLLDQSEMTVKAARQQAKAKLDMKADILQFNQTKDDDKLQRQSKKREEKVKLRQEKAEAEKRRLDGEEEQRMHAHESELRKMKEQKEKESVQHHLQLKKLKEKEEEDRVELQRLAGEQLLASHQRAAKKKEDYDEKTREISLDASEKHRELTHMNEKLNITQATAAAESQRARQRLEAEELLASQRRAAKKQEDYDEQTRASTQAWQTHQQSLYAQAKAEELLASQQRAAKKKEDYDAQTRASTQAWQTHQQSLYAKRVPVVQRVPVPSQSAVYVVPQLVACATPRPALPQPQRPVFNFGPQQHQRQGPAFNFGPQQSQRQGPAFNFGPQQQGPTGCPVHVSSPVQVTVHSGQKKSPRARGGLLGAAAATLAGMDRMVNGTDEDDDDEEKA